MKNSLPKTRTERDGSLSGMKNWANEVWTKPERNKALGRAQGESRAARSTVCGARRRRGSGLLQQLFITVLRDQEFDERLTFRVRRDDGRASVDRDLDGLRLALRELHAQTLGGLKVSDLIRRENPVVVRFLVDARAHPDLLSLTLALDGPTRG